MDHLDQQKWLKQARFEIVFIVIPELPIEVPSPRILNPSENVPVSHGAQLRAPKHTLGIIPHHRTLMIEERRVEERDDDGSTPLHSLTRASQDVAPVRAIVCLAPHAILRTCLPCRSSTHLGSGVMPDIRPSPN